MKFLLAYYTIVSIATLLVWGYDKSQAMRHRWRVPEKKLIALTMVGGFPGALLGMPLFHHKTRKSHFWLIALASGLAHILILAVAAAALI